MNNSHPHTGIMWFRQDLRVQDNTALINACQECDKLALVFCFDPNILERFGYDDTRLLFLRSILYTLKQELIKQGNDVYIVNGDPKTEIPKLAKQIGASKVYANKSYGPYGQDRDTHISQILAQQGRILSLHEDYILIDPQHIKPYKVYRPFFNAWDTIPKQTPTTTPCIPPIPDNIPPIHKLPHSLEVSEHIRHPYFAPHYTFNYPVQNYEHKRNDLWDPDSTSQISPYLRFGVVSIREAYAWGHANQSYKEELAWRDFWNHVAVHFPWSREVEFLEKRRDIIWENNQYKWQAFINARTGFPIVDAAIYQLKNTNYMHNRARMIVASFLTKDLHIDWRWGEEFFAKYLLDYDQNINIGNWQWAASVGADPKPLRIFNPDLQKKRYDPTENYITRHLPNNYNEQEIVNHKEVAQKAKELYNGILDNKKNALQRN